MKNKHWLAVILVISLLAIAFLWDGNHGQSAVRPAESSTAAKDGDRENLFRTEKEQQNKGHNSETGIVKPEKAGEGAEAVREKDTAEVLPDQAEEAKKTVTGTGKKPVPKYGSTNFASAISMRREDGLLSEEWTFSWPI